MKFVWFCLLLVAVPSCSAQGRFDSGPLRGFTRSAPEHIIVPFDETIIAPKATGSIIHAPDGVAIEGVLIELRGPGASTRIRSAVTNAAGRFDIPRTPNGRYRFKVTLDGFSSVIGDFVISQRSRQNKPILIGIRPSA